MHVYYRIEQKNTACLSQHVCVGYLGQNMKRQRTFQPPKGGARQRLERNAAQAKIQFANSSLARLLMLLWSTGTLSPQMIQKIAAATKDDIEKVPASSTCPFDDITFLADMGTKGANPQNMHSELTNRFNFKICEPGLFMLPLVVSAAKKLGQISNRESCCHMCYLRISTISFLHYSRRFSCQARRSWQSFGVQWQTIPIWQTTQLATSPSLQPMASQSHFTVMGFLLQVLGNRGQNRWKSSLGNQ